MPRRTDPAPTLLRPRIAHARDLRPILAGEVERPQHADEHAACRRDIGARGVRGIERVADEPPVRVLEAARLDVLPQPERIDDLLAAEIEERSADPHEL